MIECYLLLFDSGDIGPIDHWVGLNKMYGLRLFFDMLEYILRVITMDEYSIEFLSDSLVDIENMSIALSMDHLQEGVVENESILLGFEE